MGIAMARGGIGIVIQRFLNGSRACCHTGFRKVRIVQIMAPIKLLQSG